MSSQDEYKMTISRTTIDKLGVKLYDKASAAVSELIANSYDADANEVTVKIPLNRWLATIRERKLIDQGLEIIVEDDGHGMTPDEINEVYLKVGTNPRNDPNRGTKTREKGRLRIGRKGIGKLAPFGICKKIEVITAGGEKDNPPYEVAHFIMDYDDIVQETDEDYFPTLGKLNHTFVKKRGTTIRLFDFLYRRTPDYETFHRQVAQRFGLERLDFQINVVDIETGNKFIVGELTIPIDEDTKIVVDNRPITLPDGTKFPVRGWVAYAQKPYPNPEVAGVRIYARGKFVSVTRDFNLSAGFTGEYTIRSYLVGLIHADWLDSDDREDLIRSDRQDILWSSEIGTAFQEWGQELIKELGRKSWSPRKEKTWKIFLETSDLENEARRRFGDEEIVQKAVAVGRAIGRGIAREDLEDNEYIKGFREVCLVSAPHILHVESLKDIEEEASISPLRAIIRIFTAAKIGEQASLGQIAQERIDAIRSLELKIESELDVEELELQQLLEEAPWLINPEWTMLSANQTFDTMRQSFETWYKKKYGTTIRTTSLKQSKRPDFIMIHVGKSVEIIEIKKPKHVFTDTEFEKVLHYLLTIENFLEENKSFKPIFPKIHATLVCDDISLDPTHTEAYTRREERGDLVKKTWLELLNDTRTVHKSFLDFYKKIRSINERKNTKR